MREIKFRAWDTKNKWMVDSDNDEWVSFAGNAFRESTRKYDTPNIEIERTVDYILMQFTGLKDKNGKEIYEGDIVCEKENSGVVYFYAPQFIVQTKEEVPYQLAGGKVNMCQLLETEIIGNIYQNPELL